MTPSSFVREVFALCRLRGAARNLPYSPRLLLALLVANCAVDALAGVSAGSDDALAHALLGAAVVLGLCAVALAIRGLSHRYVQTATALLACGLVVSLVQWPLAGLIGPLPVAADGRFTPLPPLAALLLQVSFGLLAWQMLAWARIVRESMDATLPFALVLVLTWFVAYWALDALLLGGT